MPRDLFNLLQPVRALGEANLKATTAGASVSLAGYDGAMFAVALEQLGDTLSGANNYEFHVQESNDGTTFADAPAQYVQTSQGSGPFVLKAGTANDAAQAVKVGYLGNAPYARLNVVVNGTMTNGTVISALAILGFPRHGPAGNSPQVP